MVVSSDSAGGKETVWPRKPHSTLRKERLPEKSAYHVTSSTWSEKAEPMHSKDPGLSELGGG